jgi:hypothetical protein
MLKNTILTFFFLCNKSFDKLSLGLCTLLLSVEVLYRAVEVLYHEDPVPLDTVPRVPADEQSRSPKSKLVLPELLCRI